MIRVLITVVLRCHNVRRVPYFFAYFSISVPKHSAAAFLVANISGRDTYAFQCIALAVNLSPRFRRKNDE
jgi:hypothetical protein